MPIRCDSCGGPFGLRRYPPVRIRADAKQFCCRSCAAEYRIGLILRAYWRRHTAWATANDDTSSGAELVLLPATATRKSVMIKK
jgi:hypothetical protein